MNLLKNYSYGNKTASPKSSPKERTFKIHCKAIHNQTVGHGLPSVPNVSINAIPLSYKVEDPAPILNISLAG
ncbi:MAG: hypothetical protein IPJ03_00160 [Ignavibacteriales bacterium]|nr:hypothetical protein [Ignavibacteriales bacterium]